jgi:hypothetical protein
MKISRRTLESFEHLTRASVDSVTDLLCDSDSPIPSAVFVSKNKLIAAIQDFFYEVRVFTGNAATRANLEKEIKEW